MMLAVYFMELGKPGRSLLVLVRQFQITVLQNITQHKIYCLLLPDSVSRL